jgi:hypothetical protein
MKELAEELDNFPAVARSSADPQRGQVSTEPIFHHSAEFSSGQRLLTPD